MRDGARARSTARERLGVPFPEKVPGEDADGVDRVSAAASRSDETPCGENCSACGLEFTLGYRPDPCIGGYLPGVAHACCGHGVTSDAYVCGGDCVPDQSAYTIPEKWRLQGAAALDYIERHRHLVSPDP